MLFQFRSSSRPGVTTELALVPLNDSAGGGIKTVNRCLARAVLVMISLYAGNAASPNEVQALFGMLELTNDVAEPKQRVAALLVRIPKDHLESGYISVNV